MSRERNKKYNYYSTLFFFVVILFLASLVATIATFFYSVIIGFSVKSLIVGGSLLLLFCLAVKSMQFLDKRMAEHEEQLFTPEEMKKMKEKENESAGT